LLRNQSGERRGPVVTFLQFVSVVVAAGSCNRSLPTRLLPKHSFARYSSRSTVSSSAWHGQSRCGFIWCEFLAVRATPFKASCGLASSFLAEAPHPRSPSSWPKREGSQVAARQLRSNNRPNLVR